MFNRILICIAHPVAARGFRPLHIGSHRRLHNLAGAMNRTATLAFQPPGTSRAFLFGAVNER